MIPSHVLKTLVSRHSVSETEFEVLHLAMDGKPMAEIARDLNIDAAAARKRLGEVYRKFEIAGRGPGKLAKLQQLLVNEYQEQQSQPKSENITELQSAPPDIVVAPALTTCFVEGLETLDDFYGRDAELAELEQWIVRDRCRLVELLGIGGIGKTTLVVELARRVQSDFDQVVRCSLCHAPSLQDTLTELLQLLSHSAERSVSGSLQDNLTRLLTCLQKQRCW